jgi:hypothetical protein
MGLRERQCDADRVECAGRALCEVPTSTLPIRPDDACGAIRTGGARVARETLDTRPGLR